MKAQTYIRIEKLRLRAFHGVLPQERTVGGDYEVSLRVACDFSVAMDSDNVANTVNYAALLDVVRQEMASPSQLLEHVAGRIARSVFRHFPQVTSVCVELTKLNPPFGMLTEGAGVELNFSREECKV